MTTPSPKNYLQLSPEDVLKANNARAKRESGIKIDSEQMFIAEFGKYYGFAGVSAILNDEIDSETAAWLLVAARKISHQDTYNYARATLIGSAAAQSKTPGESFKKLTADLIKNMKVDIL